uniref:Synaptotagmin 17 n=1 Tax=Hucho hucho TaxID=62062 RepID=A0A4W5JRN8_9TELE
VNECVDEKDTDTGVTHDDAMAIRQDSIPTRRRSSSEMSRSTFSLVRQLSSLDARRPSSPLVDVKPIEFWAMGPRKEVIQPLRRPQPPPDDYFRKLEPRLYSLDSSGDDVDSLTDEEILLRYQLGMLHFSTQYDLINGHLGVRVIEARDLPPPLTCDGARQDMAHSNPYVKISLLPDPKNSRQTGVKRKTQNPVFEERFTFDLLFLEAQRRTLLLSVVDFDKFSRHCVIGKVALPLSEVDLVKGGHWWKALVPSSQNEVELGELLLSLNYLPSAGRLNVDIIRAKQLLQTDMCQGSGNYTY